MTAASRIETIGSQDSLYRRFFRTQISADGTVSSAAFMTRSKKPDPNCSVYLARLTTPEAVLAAAPGELNMKIAVLGAGTPIAMGLDVVHDPQSSEMASVHYAHSEIRGLATKAQCRQLAKVCEMVDALSP